MEGDKNHLFLFCYPIILKYKLKYFNTMDTLYTRINQDWNENFIGYSALAIILSTCVGSIAIYTTMLQGNDFAQMAKVFFVVAACSAHNASILTVQKPSLVLRLLIISLVVSVITIFSSLVF